MTVPPSCSRCVIRPFCGGTEHQMEIAGCLGCAFDCHANCDWVCPRKPDFPECVREVRGLSSKLSTLLSVSTALPEYVPMIRNGFSRARPLSSTFVAIPIGEFMYHSDSKYQPIADDASQLRSLLHLRADAKILLVSVAPDRHLERFWALRHATNLYVKLSKLGLSGMTTPNFSFFEDAPRIHTIWNRRRIICVAEELAKNGIPSIPHVNALTEWDWMFWRDLLRDHTEITSVAKEFQTGLRHPDKAAAALGWIERLRDSIGREIHPIVIGGAKHTARVARSFKAFTIIDSGPFIKAVKRQRRTLRGKWRRVPTLPGQPIDDLLEANITRQSDWIRMTAASARQESLQFAC